MLGMSPFRTCPEPLVAHGSGASPVLGYSPASLQVNPLSLPHVVTIFGRWAIGGVAFNLDPQ